MTIFVDLDNKNMRKLFVTIIITMFTALAFAKGETDAKYGPGSVPVNENGRVCFTETVSIPQGMNAGQCYDMLLNWAKGRFAKPFVQAGRVLSENPDSKRFVMHADQMITFKRTGLVVDESRIEYNFQISVGKDSFTATMTDIKYRYEEGREGGGQVMSAEDWITDDEAYNAKKTKFLRRTGKFRIKTIDLKDSLFDSMKQAAAENK